MPSLLNNKDYRSPDLIKSVVTKIENVLSDIPNEDYSLIRIMNVCGTHEDSLSRWAIRDLLPSRIQLIAGPGCPVCVTSAFDIDLVIEFMKQENCKILSFGDMVGVSGTHQSLESAKTEKDDVKIVYGPNEAVNIALENPNNKYIFLSPGFETTTPMIALEIKKGLPNNLTVYASHKLVPPALNILATIPNLNIHGFILPGHVSVIIGMKEYHKLAEKTKIASVVVGFEPLDVLRGILEILEQIKNNSPIAKNSYKRVVSEDGNIIAQNIIDEVFDIVDAHWRGLGTWESSGLEIKPKFDNINAKRVYNHIKVPFESQDIPKGCSCHEIMIGRKLPQECPLFNKKCTLDKPYGPCMVGHEGTCAIQAKYYVD